MAECYIRNWSGSEVGIGSSNYLDLIKRWSPDPNEACRREDLRGRSVNGVTS